MKNVSMGLLASTLMGLGLFTTAPAQAGNLTRVGFDEFDNVGYGEAITNQWQDDYGVTFGTNTNELWLFQSTCGKGDPNRPECTSNGNHGIDYDLATGIDPNGIGEGAIAQDNVLIIQESLSQGAVPDDKAGGGTITFDFLDQGGVFFDKIALLDFDDPGKPEFKFSFADGSVSNWLGFDRDADHNDPNVTLLTPSYTGNNSMREYNFDLANVTQLDIKLPGSGAVAYFDYERSGGVEPTAVPEPASLLGLLAASLLGATSLVKGKNEQSK
ncbi:MAG: PEP-CTERM sorting domain-containing protein [Microcoleaceae cyanobacterium]